MSDLVNSYIGDYRLVEFLGAGGMGEVYRAQHSRIGRTVAIKILTVTDEGSGFTERFLNEARLQAELQHPNIATLYEFTETRGRPCIIMEYVDGETLADVIRGRGRLPAGEALGYLRSIASAVAYIHRSGIIHRDLKANNIKISSSATVKLLDFGIARRDTSPRLTRAGQFVGTLHYCSPEQLRGETVDHRSDIWALGVLLYEMLSGRVPFTADSVAGFIRQIDDGRYTALGSLVAGLPAGIDAIVVRCLQQRPERRWQSAEQLVAAVDGIGSPLPAGAGRSFDPAAILDRLPRSIRGRWPLAAGAGGVLAILVIVGLLAVGGPSPDGGSEPRQPTAPVRPLPGSGRTAVSIGVVGGTAEVRVNGRRVGSSPCTFEATVGERISLELRMPDHRPLVKRIEVLPHSNTYTYSIRDFEPR